MDFNRVSNVSGLAQEFGAGATRISFAIGPDSGTSIPGLSSGVQSNLDFTNNGPALG